jgi:hypothetical protein
MCFMLQVMGGMGGMRGGGGGVQLQVTPEGGGPSIVVSVPSGSFGGGYGMPMQPPPPGTTCHTIC